MQETGSLKKSNDDDVNNVDNNVADANAAAACKQNIQVGASTFVKIGIRIKFFFCVSKTISRKFTIHN